MIPTDDSDFQNILNKLNSNLAKSLTRKVTNLGSFVYRGYKSGGTASISDHLNRVEPVTAHVLVTGDLDALWKNLGRTYSLGSPVRGQVLINSNNAKFYDFTNYLTLHNNPNLWVYAHNVRIGPDYKFNTDDKYVYRFGRDKLDPNVVYNHNSAREDPNRSGIEDLNTYDSGHHARGMQAWQLLELTGEHYFLDEVLQKLHKAVSQINLWPKYSNGGDCFSTTLCSIMTDRALYVGEDQSIGYGTRYVSWSEEQIALSAKYVTDQSVWAVLRDITKRIIIGTDYLDQETQFPSPKMPVACIYQDDT